LVVLLAVAGVAACGGTSDPSADPPITTTTVPPQPDRIIVNTRAGHVLEVDADGADATRLFTAEGVKETDFPRSAQLWNGEALTGRWGPDANATVKNVQSGATVATGIDFWGVSPNGRLFATSREGSSIVTVTDLSTGTDHSLDLSELAKDMHLTLDRWSADSRELIVGYRRDTTPGPGTVSFVDAGNGAVTKTIPFADMSRVSGLAELFDGRLLVLDARLDENNQLPEKNTVHAVADDGKQTLLATFSPAVTQLHPDASGHHILILGMDGAHWLEPDGSKGMLFSTTPEESYWWADW
jgi:hypothetical protein